MDELMPVIYKSHSNSMIESLKDLSFKNVMVDCVLSAEGQCLKAHKVILAASSTYFQMLFTQEIDKYPIVFLKDIEFQYLKLVIDYIYNGQIEIRPSQLDTFLGVAHSLKIKGLDTMKKENIPERSIFSHDSCENPPKEEQEAPIGVVVQGVKVEDDDSEMGETEELVRFEDLEDLEFLSQQIEDNPTPIHESVSISAHSECSVSSSGNPESEMNIMDFPLVVENDQPPSPIGGTSPAIASGSSSKLVNFSKIFGKAVNREKTVPDDNVMENEDARRDADSEFNSDLEGSNNERSLNEERLSPPSPRGTRRRARQRRSGGTESNAGARATKRRIRDKRHKCHVCEKAFIVPSQLNIHMRSHTGERPFKCQQCDKAFSQRINLVNHEFTHTRKWPFPCELCGSGFVQKSGLKEHKLIHDGKKPHQCATCLKTFTKKSNLIVHLRVHEKKIMITPIS